MPEWMSALSSEYHLKRGPFLALSPREGVHLPPSAALPLILSLFSLTPPLYLCMSPTLTSTLPSDAYRHRPHLARRRRGRRRRLPLCAACH